MTKRKKLDKKDQPKSTKQKAIAKPKSDRHVKFHCLDASCKHIQHIPVLWFNHERIQCHDISKT